MQENVKIMLTLYSRGDYLHVNLLEDQRKYILPTKNGEKLGEITFERVKSELDRLLSKCGELGKKKNTLGESEQNERKNLQKKIQELNKIINSLLEQKDCNVKVSAVTYGEKEYAPSIAEVHVSEWTDPNNKSIYSYDLVEWSNSNVFEVDIDKGNYKESISQALQYIQTNNSISYEQIFSELRNIQPDVTEEWLYGNLLLSLKRYICTQYNLKQTEVRSKTGKKHYIYVKDSDEGNKPLPKSIDVQLNIDVEFMVGKQYGTSLPIEHYVGIRFNRLV